MPSSTVDIRNKNDIVQALLTHYLVHTIKSELDQFESGLSQLGILTLLHTYPSKLRLLFLASGKPQITCDKVLKMFQVCWSPIGSNRRETEEAVIYGWTEYIHGIKGMIHTEYYIRLALY